MVSSRLQLHAHGFVLAYAILTMRFKLIMKSTASHATVPGSILDRVDGEKIYIYMYIYSGNPGLGSQKTDGDSTY